MDDTPEVSARSPGDEPRANPATVFAGLAQIVYAPERVDDVFVELCRAATRLLPGCDHASIMLSRGGRFVTAAASDDTARRIDAAERALGDGPCVDAIIEDAAHIDADLTDGSPWPTLTPWILEHTPVRGAMGYRLVIDDIKVGALNLYSDSPGAFTTVAADQAAVFAAFTSVALIAASRGEHAESLRAGLRSNREIGKAIGLLMAFHKVSDDEAFDMLRKTSQDMNLKLAEVAREIVDYHKER